MKIKTKILFKLYGDIWWLDKTDQRNYLNIPKEKALYKWAVTQAEAERLFKRTIFLGIRKQLPRQYCPPKFADILLYDAWIKKVEVPPRKFSAQRQLSLFKRMSR